MLSMNNHGGPVNNLEQQQQLLQLLGLQNGNLQSIMDLAQKQLLQRTQEELQKAKEELEQVYGLYHEREEEVLRLNHQLSERDHQHDHQLVQRNHDLEEQLRQLQQKSIEQADHWAQTMAGLAATAQGQATAARVTVQGAVTGADMNGRGERHEQHDANHSTSIKLTENVEEPEEEELMEDEPAQQPAQEPLQQRNSEQTDPVKKNGTVKLCAWYGLHQKRSPTRDEIKQLSQRAGLSPSQVLGWFKRARTAEKDLSTDSLALLQASYLQNHKLVPAEKRRLALQTGRSHDEIGRWFQLTRCQEQVPIFKLSEAQLAPLQRYAIEHSSDKPSHEEMRQLAEESGLTEQQVSALF